MKKYSSPYIFSLH